ncbi:MAG: hypothetical protein ACT4N9_12065, partial [Paracoccaceae bacterium]
MTAEAAAEAPGFHLEVGDGHRLWVEARGAPGGIPAVFLHGGPGGGFQPGNTGLFDPARFRAIFFDQRGAGRSLPKGGLVAMSVVECFGTGGLILERRARAHRVQVMLLDADGSSGGFGWSAV